MRVVDEDGGDTHGNPAPVVDRVTGRVWVAETYDTGRTDSAGGTVPCDRTPHLQYSDDDGRTWSRPRDPSPEILPADWNSWYATGPVPDGTDGAVRLPYRAAARHERLRGAGEQPLLWRGGIGTSQPQVWLRGEPADNRAQGLIAVRNGAAAPQTAYVRTDWRGPAVAVRRRCAAPSPTYRAPSAAPPFGVHLGQCMDSRAFLTGALDEVRAWDRARTDAALADPKVLRSPQDTVLWLPLHRVRG
ncbi:hypothetical protein AB0L14_27000 [Streptomyces sp. NPDC052727]|uniref:hypothetical protein n=1 Tax=Streptomyces sp. NPDC052727 TaxID=3154854 RepID=UPI0034402056